MGKLRKVLVFIVLAATTVASGNPIVIPEPLPVTTSEDLVATLRGPTGPAFYEALQQAALLGPDYTWLLEELAHRKDVDALFADTIFDGLSANGDSASVFVLVDVASDTSRAWYVRTEALMAIGRSRFHAAIPSLKALAERVPGTRVGNEAERAIERIKQPGRFRDLFTFEQGYVRFGFLLDDLETVKFRKRRSDPAPIVFSAGDVRTICAELQVGERVEAHTVGTIRHDGELVFELRGGTVGELSVGVDLFSTGGLYIRSPGLAAFLARRMSGRNGEPPN